MEPAMKKAADEKMKKAAETGNVDGLDGLYSLIEQNPSILDGRDAPEFDDTPLHVAARTGKADFAMEIANLKPSLARKLNKKGLSPMHLALENGHDSIARGLVRVDKELVRVKGRGGRTPLHEVASTGNLSLLSVFLDACPASVEDTTVKLETALHLALKSSKEEAFSLLLKSLRKQDKSEILSWRDNHGDTVLHVAPSEMSDEIKDLQNVAEAGDINGLYSLIKQNHSTLDGLDALQFVDTPLHIAARDGKAEFAMEIANLKPSMARKLNEDGLSPMHLALEKEHWSIARGLVRVDKELVRVKGKGGRTPLHEVASTGNLYLLSVFLDACPASVEDTTVQLETALHLAMKSSELKAFSLLLKSLERQHKSEILSWRDNHGNTVLHVATSEYIQDFQVNDINTEGKTALEEALNKVAEAGDINGLYSLIKQNHSILDGLDALQFVDTPLHIAARDGKAEFAMEIANLKPSLARKLNEEGLSPMHLALQKGHKSIARGLVEVDKELVRVKGRGRRTPLHEVASTGNSDLLKVFLDACPASVDDTTVQLETALHLAVKEDTTVQLETALHLDTTVQLETAVQVETALHLAVESKVKNKWKAFLLLLESLRKQGKSEILSWGDNHGNTVLHVATTENKHKFVKKLLWEECQVNHMNTEAKTALDILLEPGRQGHKLVRPFRRAGALKSDEIESDKSGGFLHAMAEIRRRIFFWSNLISYFKYNPDRNSPDSVRNALLVVAGLIAAATYQTGISPPGDNWQHKFKPDHHNRRITIKGGVPAGRPFVLSNDAQFYYYSFINSLGFYMSLGMMMILTWGFPLQFALIFALLPLLINYLYSLQSIAPQGHHPLLVVLFGYALPFLYIFFVLRSKLMLQYLITILMSKLYTRSIRGQDQAKDVERQVNHGRDSEPSVRTN